MRRVTFTSMFVIVAALLVAGSAGAGTAEDIMALAKAQWAADMAKDTDGMMKNVAEDYTEFNADYPTRIDGKAMSAKFAEAFVKNSNKVIVAEMANPKVQIYGDVAILTYNYFGMTMDSDGATQPNVAKSTRVYAKMNGEWMLVHANFAPVNADD